MIERTFCQAVLQSGRIKINKKYLRLRPTRTQPSRPRTQASRPRPRTSDVSLRTVQGPRPRTTTLLFLCAETAVGIVTS